MQFSACFFVAFFNGDKNDIKCSFPIKLLIFPVNSTFTCVQTEPLGGAIKLFCFVLKSTYQSQHVNIPKSTYQSQHTKRGRTKVSDDTMSYDTELRLGRHAAFEYQTEFRSPANMSLDQLWHKYHRLLNYSVMFYFSIHHNSLGSRTLILQRKGNVCAIETRKASSLLSNLRDEAAVFTLSSFIHKQIWLRDMKYSTILFISYLEVWNLHLIIQITSYVPLPTCCIRSQHFQTFMQDSFSHTHSFNLQL